MRYLNRRLFNNIDLGIFNMENCKMINNNLNFNI